MILAFWLLQPMAYAALDPKCDALARPDDYDDQVQQDFLLNYFALTTSFSAIHAAIPHDAGRGSLGIDLGVIPPLNCFRRAAFNYTKTEDTNKSPLLPRLRATFALPAGKWVVPYVGAAYMGPIPVGGVSNVTFGTELGVGFLPAGPVQPGIRLHAAFIRSIGEIAGPLEEGDPTVDDLYTGSTMGMDLMVSTRQTVGDHELSPYLALGLLDASAAFVVGDDGVVLGNQHPYLGPTLSIGLDALLSDKVRLGAELYEAFGGFSRPEDLGKETKEHGFGTYGRLTTVRLRAGWEFGKKAKSPRQKKGGGNKGGGKKGGKKQ
ncbi:MAG: hypothetical protein ACI8PZ_004933 [Myxococcota bacterium]|jgi:hypothetical protein